MATSLAIDISDTVLGVLFYRPVASLNNKLLTCNPKNVLVKSLYFHINSLLTYSTVRTSKSG